jgi:hypothetical protein
MAARYRHTVSVFELPDFLQLHSIQRLCLQAFNNINHPSFKDAAGIISYHAHGD